MTRFDHYQPGSAEGARIDKDGDKWTLVLVRELRHAPEKVWRALTDPADVLAALLDGAPLGRIVGVEVMQFEGWQRLKAEYEKQFGVTTPSW